MDGVCTHGSLLHQPTAPPEGDPDPQFRSIGDPSTLAGDGEKLPTQISGGGKVDGACVPPPCNLGQCQHSLCDPWGPPRVCPLRARGLQGTPCFPPAL